MSDKLTPEEVLAELRDWLRVELMGYGPWELIDRSEDALAALQERVREARLIG